MSLDLDDWDSGEAEGPAGVDFAEVVDEEGLRKYEDIVITCWELDESDREHVSRLNRYWSGERARGRRWLAFVAGEAVGKGYLSLAGPPGVASIYGMSVRRRRAGWESRAG